MLRACLRWVVLAAAVATVTACGSGDDSDESGTPTPVASSDSQLFAPPFEGPQRQTATERRDYRQDPEWALPSPAAVPTPADGTDPVLHPVPQDCPSDWQVLERPTEGFRFCHPPDWVVRQGSLTAPNEDSWYGAGIFDFTDAVRERQLAHVSVYVIPPFVRPVRYTIDCPDPTRVTFAGRDAVVCPSFSATSPEARIISYHVSQGDRDYFVNVAAYYEFDAAADQYTSGTSAAALATALQIVGTFQLTAAPSQSRSTTPGVIATPGVGLTPAHQ